MDLIVIAAISVLIPLHVIEEWVFPGGFHYHYNTVMKSKQLDRYPMSRLTDMLTNFIATILIPENCLKKENNDFNFESAGYYEKFL